jgi:metalloendopeptidase OMA1, mitochondrial
MIYGSWPAANQPQFLPMWQNRTESLTKSVSGPKSGPAVLFSRHSPLTRATFRAAHQLHLPIAKCDRSATPPGENHIMSLRRSAFPSDFTTTFIRRVFICVATASLLVSGGCTSGEGEGPGHRAQTLALTADQELSLGQKAYQEVLRKSHVVDGPDAKRIRDIGSRIVKAAEIRPLQHEMNLRVNGYKWQWEYTLIENKQINAFCLPGGKVAVFTGLIPVAGNDDQLATVMSHEIAHALAHHASERIAREQMYERALAVANGAIGSIDPADRRQLIGLLGAGAEARSLAYSRQQESEADHIGLFLMTFAGYEPEQAVRFWERMQQAAAGHSHPPEILSDHPSDAKRLAQLKQWVSHAQAAKQAWNQGKIAPGAQ